MMEQIDAKIFSPRARVGRLAFCTLMLTIVLPASPLCFSAISIQQKTTPQTPDLPTLSIGAPIERELIGGQTHVYQITLSAGQFALVHVEQRGVEVVLAANGPDGKEFALVDLRTGGRGVEPLTIVADEDGDYLLKIISRNPKAAAGRYEAKISELRAATEQDRGRLKAQTLSYEARALALEQIPEAKRKAVQLYGEALLLWRQVPEPLWEAGLLWRLGRLHIELTEFTEAKEYFSRGVSARRAIGDRRGEAAAQNGVCEALHYLGETREKAACLDALIPIYREFGEPLEEGKVLSNIAVTFRDLGDYQAALQTAQRALSIFQTEGDRVQESFALNTLGQIYWSLNEYQIALDHYERALAIRRGGSDKRLLGLTLGDIGAVYEDLGELSRALDYFNQAIVISEELGDRRTKAIRLQSLGVLWEKMGETDKALDAQTQSLTLARAVGDRRAEGRTLIAMSDLYLLLGEKGRATDALTRALELSRDTGDSVGEAASLRKMGKLAATNGDRQRATELLQKSLSLARDTGDLRSERDALIVLAQTERERENLSEARAYHEQALALTESLRTKIFPQGLRSTYLASRQEEYELYVDLLMQMHRRHPNAGYSSAALQIAERGRARSLLDTLAEARADIRQGVDAGLLAEERKLTEQIRATEQRRAKLMDNRQAPNQAEALARQSGELLDKYQSLQGRIRAVSPRYAALTQPQPVTAAEIQTQLLDDQTVLLEFALGTNRSWMWAVTSDGVTSFELAPRGEIEAAARKFNELLTARQAKNNESSILHARRAGEADAKIPSEAAALSRMLLGPIFSKLNREWKGRRLLIVGAGALDYLPFAALPIPPETGVAATDVYRPLITDHEVVSLPSASVLALIRRESAGRQEANGRLAILADPVFETSDPRVMTATKKRMKPGRIVAHLRSAEAQPINTAVEADWLRAVRSFDLLGQREGLSRLPFSRQEAENISALIPRDASILKATDFKANHALVMGGGLGRYRIVHFATHGLLNGEHPELSGLVLSLVDEEGRRQDGFLRLHEIYNLRLSAELVVLSACQTALGKEVRGEGLVGLTRGFMYAGAERVVASLWQVDDLATAELMGRFYAAMLQKNRRPAAALREAQLEMMKQKRWQSPYFWAGFVLQGEYQ